MTRDWSRAPPAFDRLGPRVFGINLFPIQMGKCPVIRGDGVMGVAKFMTPLSAYDADTSPFEWGGR